MPDKKKEKEYRRGELFSRINRRRDGRKDLRGKLNLHLTSPRQSDVIEITATRSDVREGRGWRGMDEGGREEELSGGEERIVA